MADDERPPAFDDFDKRLAKARGVPPGEADRSGHADRRSGWGPGLQAGVEIIAGVAGGALIGYGLDSWLGTRPWLMIVLFMAGAAAGFLNAFRHLRRASMDDPDRPDGRV